MPNESDRKIAETIVEVALHNPGDPARKLEAAILLVNEEDPLYSNILTDISVEGVSWFSRSGEDMYDQSQIPPAEPEA